MLGIIIFMENKLVISYTYYKQSDKWHYEIRRGYDPLRGEILSEGHDFNSKQEARKEMQREIRKLTSKNKKGMQV